LKVKLKKTWTIERTFEYDIENNYFKSEYKTQKNFKEQFTKNESKVVNFLSQCHCENVSDDESEGIFEIALTK
jgi:hypothetical protein